jgi:tetratricopeptide (TPR) repeat protein
MQLDLFCDNRRTIRLNDADELLRALRLEEALAVYDELLADAPEDPELLALRGQVLAWRVRLAAFTAAPAGAARLHDLWPELTPQTPLPLAAALRALLVEELLRLPSPELIYIPPRFHIGTILLAAGKFSEAEYWFARALGGGIGVRGRFLAWRGDALARLGDRERARDAYLAAFLEGPHEVDLPALQSPQIHDLLFSLEGEADEVGEMDHPAWLPVWGWLQGEFRLPMNEITADRETFGSALQEAEQTGSLAPPRLWFDYLRYAECLRTLFRDDRELVRVRRRMRELSGFMFDGYMKKIRGAAPPDPAR